MLTEKEWLDFGVKPLYEPAYVTCANCEDRQMELGVRTENGHRIRICWECGANEDF